MTRLAVPSAPRLPYRVSRLPSPVAGGQSPAFARPSSSILRPSSDLRPRDIAALQRLAGNRAVQRLLDSGRPTLPAPTGGQPLPKPVAAQMQRAFAADLSGVRVSESPAVASLGARAVTQGSHIAFAPGELRPHTAAGQKLLGHELTHVLQQRAGGQPNPPTPFPAREGGATKFDSVQRFPASQSLQGDDGGSRKLVVQRAPPSLSGKGVGGLGRLAINPALEAEADRLGALAAQGQATPQAVSAATGGAQLMVVGDVVSLAVSAGVTLAALLTWAAERGWAYALGETERVRAGQTGEETGARPGFVSSVEQHKEAFIRAVIARSNGQMDRAAAEALYVEEVQSDLEARDEVTGFVGAAHRKPTLDNALQHVRRDGTAAAYYVEADVRNLGGLNAHLGHSGADLVYRQLAQTTERHLRRLSGEVHAFRHGGDEVSFVIVGEQGSLTAAAVETALLAADEENAAYTQGYTFLSIAPYARNKRLALSDIPHLKHGGRSGTGLIWAVSQADAHSSSADEVITAADQLVEARKKIAGEYSAPDPLYTQAPTLPPEQTRDTGSTTTTATLVKLAWSAGIEMTTLVRWAWDKGWEYAYDQVLKYSDVDTASLAYVSSAERQKEEFVRAAVSLSYGKLSRAEAVALYAKDVRAFVEARDVVTGFMGARHRLPTVRNALEYVRQNRDASAYYIEADVRNLSGLNAHLGHSQADAVYQRLAKTAEERLRGLPGQCHAFRHGGDEISFVVTGLRDDLTHVEVEAALAAAARDNASYAAGATITSIAPDTKGQRLKLKDVPHPKYKGQRGTGLIHAVAEIAPTIKDFNDVVRAAEALVESRKLGIG